MNLDEVTMALLYLWAEFMILVYWYGAVGWERWVWGGIFIVYTAGLIQKAFRYQSSLGKGINDD